MTVIGVHAMGRATVAGSIEAVWRPIATIPAMAALMGVEACSEIPGGWRWDLGQRGALGRSARVLFDVATQQDPPAEVTFRPIGAAERWARGTSSVRLALVDGLVAITVDVPLDIDLPLPRLVAAPIGAVIRREVQATVDGFLARWQDSLAG